MFQYFKKSITLLILTLALTVYLGFGSVPTAFALNVFSLPGNIQEVFSNQHLIKDVKKFMNTTPETFCRAYSDQLNGVDNGTWEAIIQAGESFITVGTAIQSALTAGAGSLAGYAGIASAVSHLGLGGLTQFIAGMMGSQVTGAAATAVVTSTVGGPLVMGALLVGGTSAAAFGTYELGKVATEHLVSLAKSYCNTPINAPNS
ncbi:hypothetical protein NIES25_16620 [Nostoc linckia NIES-25]|nr:hypothetical protein NIES25_16620 [Nostoc linckia NIES-25]